MYQTDQQGRTTAIKKAEIGNVSSKFKTIKT